jgi:hypothetical protein
MNINTDTQSSPAGKMCSSFNILYYGNTEVIVDYDSSALT